VFQSIKPSWWFGMNTCHCERGSLRVRFLRTPDAHFGDGERRFHSMVSARFV
jgi:hypothetical protein